MLFQLSYFLLQTWLNGSLGHADQLDEHHHRSQSRETPDDE